jgi:FhaA, N-terminal domain/FHA domain
VSLLRGIEQKLEGLFEGTFNKAFKSEVQPIEIARKLAKEMSDSKTISISRTYVPNQYTVYLSPQDRGQFEGWEDAARKELSDYLLQYARDEGLTLTTRPTVDFATDDRLGVGEFGIQAMLIQAPESEEAEPQQADFGHTMVYSPSQSPRSLDPVQAPSRGKAMLVGAGKRTVLSGSRILIGRSRECDIQLDDPNTSRRHAEVRREGGAWVVADLGSTNGIKVNGSRVAEAELHPGDEVTLGLVRLRFERE